MKPPTCSRCQAIYSLGARDTGGQRGPRDYGRHPMLLRCGHSFCKPCLRKYETTEDIIHCPTCQKPTKLSLKAVSPDVYTVGLLWTRRLELELQSDKISTNDRMKVRKTPAAVSEKNVLCVECGIAANCKCLKCETVMCRSCFDKVHQISVSLRKHQAVPLQDCGPLEERVTTLKKARPRNCSVHEQCQIEYFCLEDDQLICSRCVIMGDHKGHDVQTLEEKNKDSLSEMEPAILGAQETVWRLEKSEKAVSQAMPLAQVDTSRMVDEVRLHFRELHSMLQAREEQILDDVREASLNVTKPFQETKAFLQNERIMLEMALTDAARAMQGSMHSVMDADLIVERLHKAKDVACVATVDKKAVTEPFKFSFDATMKDTIYAHGDIATKSAAQMFTLSQAGPDAPKPPAEELRQWSVSDLDSLSTDTESVADSAPVIVEEEEEVEEEDEETETVEEKEPSDSKKTETNFNKPGKRLVAGHSEKVQVTHIRTPSNFYVQLMSGRGELETMQRQINHHCRSQSEKLVPELLDTGSLVLAQFSQDKTWYRAVVTDIIECDKDDKQGGTTYQVFFMDYGNSETVTIHKLRPMKDRFERKPAFAYECSLFDIFPADKTKGWRTESVQVMLEITGNAHIIMKIMDSGSGALSVDIVRPEMDTRCVDDQPVSLRDTLIFMELATSHHSTLFNTPPVGSLNRDFITLPRPSDGKVVDIGINYVDNPFLFYALIDEGSNGQYLQRLVSTMQDTYTKDSLHRYTIFCPKLNMLCVAKYEKDGKWYRARVTGLPGACRVQVQFVDYGNTETVHCTDIRKILRDHIKCPRQAMECALVDVEPLIDGQWSEEALAWFKTTTDLQFGQLRVVGSTLKDNSMSGVLYVFTQDNTLCCVNHELVQHGFARSTGPWSQEPSFKGITLQLGAAQMLTSMPKTKSLSPSPSPISSPQHHSSSPSSTHHTRSSASPNPRRTPPRAQHSSPKMVGGKSPGSASKRKSPTCRNIMLRNLHTSPERVEGEGKREGVGKPENGAVEVVICCYHSPTHFFIQLQEKQKQLLNLMSELAMYETEAASGQEWKVGQFCVAKYTKDDSWYRATITAKLQDAVYQVCLVDFGHTDTVPASQLRTLKKNDGSLSCFAERCHLASLCPAGSMDSTRWSASAVDFMADEVRAKRLFVKVEGNPVADRGMPVDILIEELIPETAFDPQRHEYISLVARLQDKGLAFPVSRTQSTESDANKKGESQTPRAEPFQTKVILTSPEASPNRSEQADDTEVNGASQTDSSDGNPPSSDIPSLEGKPPAVSSSPAGNLPAVSPPPAATPTASMVTEPVVIEQPDCDVLPHPPPPSTTLSVLPMHIDNDGIIYAHDCDEEKKSTALLDLIDEYAKTEAPRDRLKVKVGQICLAHFSNDDAWYRARVLEVTQKDVKVKYVDFGNSCRVDTSLVRRIPLELCDNPQIAYEFKLHNLKPETVDRSWPSSFLDYMQKLLVNTPCTALIKNGRDRRPLEADLVFGESQSVSTTLLQIGVVSKDNDMEEFYERTADITSILKCSNPYFPLRPGQPGDIFTGLVTHVELPNLVYIQRCAAAPDTGLPEDVVKFVQMMDDLNASPDQDSALQELPAAGEMCAARFSQDDRWYRALVVKNYPHDQTTLVYYVDYGNSEVVTLDRLQALSQKFQDTPAQALRAFINLDLPEGAKRWSLSTFRAMADAVFLRRHVVLIKFSDPLTVELFSEDEQLNGASILSYQQLINNGLVTQPKPVVVADTSDEDNVIVESYTETEETTDASDK